MKRIFALIAITYGFMATGCGQRQFFRRLITQVDLYLISKACNIA
jgi:hypothetical protein